KYSIISSTVTGWSLKEVQWRSRRSARISAGEKSVIRRSVMRAPLPDGVSGAYEVPMACLRPCDLRLEDLAEKILGELRVHDGAARQLVLRERAAEMAYERVVRAGGLVAFAED